MITVLYSLMYDKCSAEYESKYQVLELTHDTYGKYTWINNPCSLKSAITSPVTAT